MLIRRTLASTGLCNGAAQYLGRSMLALLGVLLSVHPVRAEDHGRFFAFVAPLTTGSDSRSVVPQVGLPTGGTLVHVGGGGEAALGRHWGVGTEIGGLARTGGQNAVADVSIGAFFHPLGQHRSRFDPFGAFGSSWLVNTQARQSVGLPHLGAGVHYWLPERHGYKLGLTAEWRPGIRGGLQHADYQEMRMGLSLWQ